MADRARWEPVRGDGAVTGETPPMVTRRLLVVAAVVGLGFVPATSAFGQQPTRREMNELRRLVEQQAESIRELKARINELEGGKVSAPTPAGVPAAPAPVVTAPTEAPPEAPMVTKPGEAPSPAEEAEARMAARRGVVETAVGPGGNFDDKQEAAARPEAYALGRGFIPIPNTVFAVKFNPKPRLDMMFNNVNPGGPYRFAPALMITEGSPGFGGGEQFNATANGSQLRVDIRAPSQPGNFRLYYQNDFFGSDTKQMQYRLQHLYGQYYGVVAGFTYGVFEDPDAWPDTVDYEGPNSVLFARRPLVHYTRELTDTVDVTLGVEDPGLALDLTGNPGAISQARAPDGGFNVRWVPGDIGHVQFSSIFRSLNATAGNDFRGSSAFGWGFNLGGSVNLTENDSLMVLGVYGHGVGGMGNDTSFVNSDAALDGDGDLVALEYASGMIAFTHRWTPRWRSTGTFGYVNLGNTSLQAGSAYDISRYGSLNVIYQLFKRVSIGVESLYGFREVKSGDTTDDVLRFQLGLVYSPFD